MTIDRKAKIVTYDEHRLPFTQPDPESILIQGATRKGNLQIGSAAWTRRFSC